MRAIAEFREGCKSLPVKVKDTKYKGTKATQYMVQHRDRWRRVCKYSSGDCYFIDGYVRIAVSVTID